MSPPLLVVTVWCGWCRVGRWVGCGVWRWGWCRLWRVPGWVVRSLGVWGWVVWGWVMWGWRWGCVGLIGSFGRRWLVGVGGSWWRGCGRWPLMVWVWLVGSLVLVVG